MPAAGSIAGYAEDVLVASATQTASGNSGPLPGYGGAATLRVQLNITAVTGSSPTLDVVLEDTIDGTNWNNVGTFTQKTGTGVFSVNVTTPFCDRIRVRWTLGGTASPSFTFEIRAASQSPLS